MFYDKKQILNIMAEENKHFNEEREAALKDVLSSTSQSALNKQYMQQLASKLPEALRQTGLTTDEVNALFSAVKQCKEPVVNPYSLHITQPLVELAPNQEDWSQQMYVPKVGKVRVEIDNYTDKPKRFAIHIVELP